MRAVFPHRDEALLRDEFFRGTGRGFFVEVGACEPVEESQSYALEQRGWQGVLIEPQPGPAERLRRQRRAAVYEVACSSRANAGRVMPLSVGGRMLASLQPDYYIAGFENRQLAVVNVPVRTLDDILVEAGAPTPIDFVSIDVEYHELEVLDGFDIARWCPRLILIEDIVADLRIHHYLCARGYRWIRRTGQNGWYVPEPMAAPVSLFGHWQFLRKHVLAVPIRRLRDAKRRWLQQ